MDKKEVEEGASKDQQKPSIRMCKTEADEMPLTNQQQQPNWKRHPFSFCYKNKTYAVSCDTSQTVLDALDTSQAFKQLKENNKEKELVIKRQKEAWAVTGAAVKADFPCCLIQKDEILNIHFIQMRESQKIKKPNSKLEEETSSKEEQKTGDPESLVTFNIKTKGGGELKGLMKNMELGLEVEDVCVYALKDETLRSALMRDGRFIEEIFKRNSVLLDLGTNTMYELSNCTEHVNRKCFQINVMSTNTQLEGQEGKNTLPGIKKNKGKQKKTMKAESPSIQCEKIEKSEEFVKILRTQYDEIFYRLKQQMSDAEIEKFFRAEYDKSNQIFSEVKTNRKLVHLSNSVCQIRRQGSAKGTGFLLFNRFILTNAHVIGDYEPFTRKLKKTFTAVFGYEKLDETDETDKKDKKDENDEKVVNDVKHVKEHAIAIFHGKDEMNRFMDYALLELDVGDEVLEYPDLLRQSSSDPAPNSGGICIIGHPYGGVKMMDICFIIGKENQQEAVHKHISDNISFIHVMKQMAKEEKWKFHENQITYDSCFFHGSSGSPVFDEDCRLIGIHTGGYVYEGEGGKTRSIKEYSFSMQPILENIIKQVKNNERLDILELLSKYKSLKSLLHPEVTDVEMTEEPQNQED